MIGLVVLILLQWLCLLTSENRIFKYHEKPEVYLVDQENVKHLLSSETWISLGFDFEMDIHKVDISVIDGFKDGEPIQINDKNFDSMFDTYSKHSTLPKRSYQKSGTTWHDQSLCPYDDSFFQVQNTNEGDLSMFHSFFAKVKKNEPIKVVFFGGSVTFGAGGSNPKTKAFTSLVEKWFQMNFFHRQNRFEYINCDIWGGYNWPPHYQPSDLIIVDVGINSSDNVTLDETLSFMRKQNTAVLAVNWQRHINTNHAYSHMVQKHGMIQGMDYHHKDQFKHHYFELCNFERSLSLVYQYYRVPTLSFKSALTPYILDSKNDVEMIGLIYNTEDLVHPNDFGHSMIASSVVQFIEKHLYRYYSVAEKHESELENCHSKWEPLYSSYKSSTLPLFFDGMSSEMQSTYVLAENILQIPTVSLTPAEGGWVFMDGSKSGVSALGRSRVSSIQSMSVGDIFEIQDLLISDKLTIVYMRSYKTFGSASVDCTCDGVVYSYTLDGHWEDRVSLAQRFRIDGRTPNNNDGGDSKSKDQSGIAGKHCHVKITNKGGVHGNHFKIMAISY